jgi:hypothetical protein
MIRKQNSYYPVLAPLPHRFSASTPHEVLHRVRLGFEADERHCGLRSNVASRGSSGHDNLKEGGTPVLPSVRLEDSVYLSVTSKIKIASGYFTGVTPCGDEISWRGSE